MFPPYCHQEKPHKKRNEKFAIETELQDSNQFQWNKRESALRPINVLKNLRYVD